MPDQHHHFSCRRNDACRGAALGAYPREEGAQWPGADWADHAASTSILRTQAFPCFEIRPWRAGLSPDWRLLYRGLCQGTNDVICRREAASLNLEERSRAVLGQSHQARLEAMPLSTASATSRPPFSIGTARIPHNLKIKKTEIKIMTINSAED